MKDAVISLMKKEKAILIFRGIFRDRLLDALKVCARTGVHLAEIFIKEIGNSVGYAKSEAAYMSEGTYKAYKSLAKKNIVRKLYLE